MIKGSIVALVTPMKEDKSIDYDAFEKLIEFHIENNTQAIVPVGTTGESPTISNKEHYELIKKTVEVSKGRIAVIAGTGSNSTREAIKQTQIAKDSGADACLSVVPYYNKPTQYGLRLHYEEIAKACEFPMILYNVPHRTMADLSDDLTVALSKVDNIIGIKDATGEIERAKFLIDNCPKDFAIYSGDDATAHRLILEGGHGVISVTANIAPQKMQDLVQACLQKDESKVKKINETFQSLHQVMGLQSNPIPVKWALFKMGLIGEAIRLPLHPLDSQFHEKVLQAMKLNDISV